MGSVLQPIITNNYLTVCYRLQSLQYFHTSKKRSEAIPAFSVFLRTVRKKTNAIEKKPFNEKFPTPIEYIICYKPRSPMICEHNWFCWECAHFPSSFSFAKFTLLILVSQIDSQVCQKCQLESIWLWRNSENICVQLHMYNNIIDVLICIFRYQHWATYA